MNVAHAVHPSPVRNTTGGRNREWRRLLDRPVSSADHKRPDGAISLTRFALRLRVELTGSLQPRG
jgi:hypothetical protein